ncbi:3-oxoacyl-[acyl-carrier protein] reductase [Filimonas zeae]|uniref:Oxidoreductase n=1 Tax=Filimonas zeae TaxID=1737353 RepID=A0A917MTX2_9BACT|nr:glucose 1-dehydrogenase [Filimonas zeae]MDR6339357.1 3-oxoacyl-[acyl-carrier protein] reductase [Filimonas zeae]GGH63957.1 oxidoreductase [Filimonas zeae]
MKRLDNKVAVVTGASKGIGAGIAEKLAADGAAVVVNYAAAKEDAEKVVGKIVANGGRAVAVQGDVSKAADVDRLFAEAVGQYGAVDILVNNAGVYQWSALEDFTEESYHHQFNINVLGVLLASKAAAKNFGKKGGSIINIGSAVSSATPAGSAVYTATKSAVDAITRVLSKELGPKNIRVNSVNPGIVVTEGSTAAGFIGSEAEAGMVSTTPLGRVGQPEDIALATAFLASDDARWVTGELILASGGLR